MRIGTKIHYLVKMTKNTKELWDEYCERAHRPNPANWIQLSPNIATKLKEIQKKDGRKRDKSR